MAFGKPDAGKPPVRFDEGRSETVIGLVPFNPSAPPTLLNGAVANPFSSGARVVPLRGGGVGWVVKKGGGATPLQNAGARVGRAVLCPPPLANGCIQVH